MHGTSVQPFYNFYSAQRISPREKLTRSKTEYFTEYGLVFSSVKHFFVTNHISHRVGEDASTLRASGEGGGRGKPRGGISFSKYLNIVFEFCIWILYLNIVFVKELFAELDKEEDGIVYTKNLIIQLRALNEDMDKNLKVYIVQSTFQDVQNCP